MFAHQPTPTPHYTTARILTVVVLPLAIYVLQLLGKIFGLAALLAGVLVCLKVLLDLVSTHHALHALRAVPPVQCHYCHTHRGTFRRHPNPDHRLPADTSVCEYCYFTRLLTAEYMSTYYEPL